MRFTVIVFFAFSVLVFGIGCASTIEIVEDASDSEIIVPDDEGKFITLTSSLCDIKLEITFKERGDSWSSPVEVKVWEDGTKVSVKGLPDFKSVEQVRVIVVYASTLCPVNSGDVFEWPRGGGTGTLIDKGGYYKLSLYDSQGRDSGLDLILKD